MATKSKFTIETPATPAIAPVPLNNQPQPKPTIQSNTGFTPAEQSQYDKTLAMFSKPTLPPVSAITTPPVKLPEPPKDNTTTNLGMAMDSNLANITANTQVQTEAEKAKADLAKTRDGILSSFQNEGAEVEKITNDNELIQKKARAVQIQNELTAMEKNYRDEVSALKQNPEGKLTGALNAEINKATDRYNNNRANVSIAYNTALGDYQASKDAVDLKVQSLKTYNENQLKMYGMIKDEVYNDMTESEKVQANNIQREKEAKANLVNDAYARIVETAAQNGASAATLSAIDAAARDPKATPATIATAAGRYLTDVKATTSSDLKTSWQDINGQRVLVNDQTGEIISKTDVTNTSKDSEKLLLINDISNILADPNIDSVFGLTNMIGRSIPGTPAYTLSSQVNNVIQQAALAERGKLKGQGAVSDFEGKMLKEAVTALKLNQNPEDAKKALVKLRGAVTTSSGGSASVVITNKEGVSKPGLADQKTIMDAINSGYRVEYK